MQEIDQRDRDLIQALQNDIPLLSTPFAVIGQMIDMSEKEVIKRCEKLKREGLLKQIGGQFDARALGYKSCLVAAQVHEDALERSATIVNMHPGVSQNYRRNHDFNLWFTIAVPPSSRLGLERTVEILGDEAGAEAVRMLPAVRQFKPLNESEPEGTFADPKLSDREIEVIRALQTDLPLQPRPFDALAKMINLSAEDLIAAAKQFIGRKAMRRYAASVQQRKPFTAHAMGVWSIPNDQVDALGPKMAAHKAVSQCYVRPTYSDWPYNVFTTVQGRSVDECEAVLSEISDEIGIHEMRALFPTKEYKRARLSFFNPENDAWEAVRLAHTETAAS